MVGLETQKTTNVVVSLLGREDLFIATLIQSQRKSKGKEDDARSLVGDEGNSILSE